MASAPKVKKGGHDAAKGRREAAKKALQVTMPDGTVFVVALANVPTIVRFQVAEQLKPIEELWEKPGIHTYAAMWWITRLLAGESVTWRQAAAEWDGTWPGVVLGDLATEVVDAKDVAGDHPE